MPCAKSSSSDTAILGRHYFCPHWWTPWPNPTASCPFSPRKTQLFLKSSPSSYLKNGRSAILSLARKFIFFKSKQKVRPSCCLWILYWFIHRYIHSYTRPRPQASNSKSYVLSIFEFFFFKTQLWSLLTLVVEAEPLTTLLIQVTESGGTYLPVTD